MKKIKLLIASKNEKSASWVFYSKLFKEINRSKDIQLIKGGHQLHQKRIEKINIALLFGKKFPISKIRKKNPSICFGLLEPRASQKKEIKYYDFIVTNSLEANDFFSSPNIPSFILPTYPVFKSKRLPKKINTDSKLVLGYHGNKIHLEAMYPRITDALNKLIKIVKFEFSAIYNLKDLGRWNEKGIQGIKVNHIQYDPKKIERDICNIDIGLVPQLIPVRKSRLLMWALGTITSRFNERFDNFLCRFKETTNNGRGLVFAQFKIPIIADMTPSSCSFLGENEHGNIAYSTNEWFKAMLKLALDTKQRKIAGQILKKRYDYYTKNKSNIKYFIAFLKTIYNEKRKKIL